MAGSDKVLAVTDATVIGKHAGTSLLVVRHGYLVYEKYFGRGNRAYDRMNGDPTQKPNPSLGTLRGDYSRVDSVRSPRVQR